MLRKISFVLFLIVFSAIVVYDPATVSEPAVSAKDHAKEDLTRVDYPSMRTVRWKSCFLRPQDTLESLFGENWVHVARFNRIDRRHAYPGLTIRVPDNMDEIKNYTPLPPVYEPALRREKYILIDMTEQWLGAY